MISTGGAGGIGSSPKPFVSTNNVLDMEGDEEIRTTAGIINPKDWEGVQSIEPSEKDNYGGFQINKSGIDVIK